MNTIQTGPLDTHHEMSSGELLKTLLEAGDWTYEQFSEAVGISLDTAKKWSLKNVMPKYNYRIEFLAYLDKICSNDDIARQWKTAFNQAWMRQRVSKNTAKQASKDTSKEVTQQASLDKPENQLQNNSENTAIKDKPITEQKRKEDFIYLMASVLFVLTGIFVYSRYHSEVFYSIQLLLIMATVTSLATFLNLFAFKKMKTVFIWFSLKTVLLGLLLLGYFEFFPNNSLNGRLAATVVILPLIVLLLFNVGYLLLYSIRANVKTIDKYQIMPVLMRPFIHYRKNFMRLLELKWFFAAGSFAILAVANLNLLLPALDSVVK